MKTWTLDTCGLLSLFVVHFMWCVLNLKTRKTVNICIIWRQQIKGLYAIGLCRPPSPGFPRRDGTMSWHFTFHFECSSCGPINPEKKKNKNLVVVALFFFYFFFFLDFGHFQIPPTLYAGHFRCSPATLIAAAAVVRTVPAYQALLLSLSLPLPPPLSLPRGQRVINDSTDWNAESYFSKSWQ